MDEKVFVADGNWYLHRIFHTQNFESKDPGMSMAYRFVALVCKDALATKCKRILVAFDGNKVFRYALFSQYKANRKKNKDEDVDLIHDKTGQVAGPYTYLDTVLAYVSQCGIPIYQSSAHEADDVLCSAAHQFKNVVLGAKDKDSYQSLVHDGVVQYDSTFLIKGKPAPRTIRAKDVKAIFGVEQKQCLDLQTLTGDDIDGIPRLVKRATAIKGITKWGSINEWLRNDSEFKASLSRKKAELNLNRKLVKLKTDISLTVPAIKWAVKDVPSSYLQLKDFCNPKSRGLF